MTESSIDIEKTFRNDFVVFILTHGRASSVITRDTLLRSGYTGRICLVVDDEDDQLEEYRRRYGDEVEVFSKDDYENKIDTGAHFGRGVVVYARNACFDIARRLGVHYFLELDDDYMIFAYTFNAARQYRECVIHSGLDSVFRSILRFFISCPPCVKSVATAQGGDFIGGSAGHNLKSIKLLRKAMNSFFCSTLRPFTFDGWINEDVNTYTSHSHRGEVFFTLNQIRLEQVDTQQQRGGLTEAYLDRGTYVKSFFSVMYHPSGVRVKTMGRTDKRIHHIVNWRRTAPKILSERWRKEEE